jgi:hypothetical protein
MWKPPLNFITLHYAYIVTLGILGIVILYPYGNLSVVDAYLFGVSSSTESGLNPFVDLTPKSMEKVADENRSKKVLT